MCAVVTFLFVSLVWVVSLFLFSLPSLHILHCVFYCFSTGAILFWFLIGCFSETDLTCSSILFTLIWLTFLVHALVARQHIFCFPGLIWIGFMFWLCIGCSGDPIFFLGSSFFNCFLTFYFGSWFLFIHSFFGGVWWNLWIPLPYSQKWAIPCYLNPPWRLSPPPPQQRRPLPQPPSPECL